MEKKPPFYRNVVLSTEGGTSIHWSSDEEQEQEKIPDPEPKEKRPRKIIPRATPESIQMCKDLETKALRLQPGNQGLSAPYRDSRATMDSIQRHIKNAQQKIDLFDEIKRDILKSVEAGASGQNDHVAREPQAEDDVPWIECKRPRQHQP